MPDPVTEKSQSVNAQLSLLVVDQLCAEDLIPSALRTAVLLKVSTGTATAKDWRTWLATMQDNEDNDQ